VNFVTTEIKFVPLFKYLELNQRAADSCNVKGNYNLCVAYELGLFSPIDDALGFKHYFIADTGGIP
tara:strand:- start:84 stop:281 length:198 start_codon:yes stop_codon:yes gene_type:complete